MNLINEASPHFHGKGSTQWIMGMVCLSLRVHPRGQGRLSRRGRAPDRPVREEGGVNP